MKIRIGKKMRGRMKKAAALTLAVISAAFVCIFPGEYQKVNAATDATVKSLEEKIGSLKNEQAALQQQIKQLQSEKGDQLAYKNSLDNLANVTQNKMQAAEDLSAALSAQITEKETEIAEKETAISDTFEKFQQRMVDAYENGNADYLTLILDAGSLSEFLSRMDRVSSIMEYDRKLMDKYAEEKKALSESKTALETAKAEQDQLVKELEADKKEYEALSNQTASYISQIEKEVGQNQALYEKNKAAEDALDAQLTAYLKELQAREQQAYVGGEFIWPLPVGHTNISSGYGWRTLFGVKDFHAAIDITAPAGTNIYASNGGKVITAASHSSYGNYVVIDHGGGKATLYAHASRLCVSVGQTVKQGDVIAKVGATGVATGNHVHFEVRVNGVRQNPLGFVTRP